MDNQLYHCTDFDSLIKILRSKYFRPSYCLEQTAIDDLFEGNAIAFPIVCFADFSNVELLRTHAINYNKKCYISLTQDWARKHKVSPVTYFEKGVFTERLYKYLAEGILGKFVNKEDNIQFNNSAALLLGYLRKYQGNYYNKNAKQWSKTVVKFYDEREWRYLPVVKHGEAYMLRNNDYLNDETLNENINKIQKDEYFLKFSWDDIVQVGVPEDKEVELKMLLKEIFDISDENELAHKLIDFELNDAK